MKKSDQYLMAQLAVLDANIPGIQRLEILETLRDAQKVELWSEEQAAKKAEAEKEASE